MKKNYIILWLFPVIRPARTFKPYNPGERCSVRNHVTGGASANPECNFNDYILWTAQHGKRCRAQFWKWHVNAAPNTKFISVVLCQTHVNLASGTGLNALHIPFGLCQWQSQTESLYGGLLGCCFFLITIHWHTSWEKVMWFFFFFKCEVIYIFILLS